MPAPTNRFRSIPRVSQSIERHSNKHRQDVHSLRVFRMYEMLDLPREVLSDILNYVQEKCVKVCGLKEQPPTISVVVLCCRDMRSRESFAEALIRALPELQERSRAVALASSDILQQKAMPLLDGRSRPSRSVTDPLGSRQQVFMLTDEIIERLSDANSVRTQTLQPHDSFASKQPLPPIASEGLTSLQ